MYLFSKKVHRSEDIHYWDNMLNIPGALTRKNTSLFIHLHSALSAKTVMVYLPLLTIR